MFAAACLSLVFVPPPVATLAVSDPVALAASLTRIFGRPVDLAHGRDLSAWRRDEPGFATLASLDGLGGPTPPVTLRLPMTAADFRANVLTDAERATITQNESRFTDGAGTVWHFAATGQSVVLSPNARLLAVNPEPRGPDIVGCELRVDLNRVRQLAGKEIAATTQLVGLMLQTGGASWLKGFDARQREVAANLVGAAYRVVADGESLTLRFAVTPAGVGLTADWRCVPGSPSAKLLAAEVPTKLREWRELPRAFPLSARHLSPAVARELAGLTREFVAAPRDADSARAIAEYDRLLAEAGRVREAGGVVAVADRDGNLLAAHAAALKSLKKGAAYRNLPIAAAPEITGTRELARARIELDLQGAAGGVADPNLRQATLASIERLAGATPEYHFGSRNGEFARVTGTDPEQRLEAFAHPKARAGSDTNLVVARNLLPAKLSTFAGWRTPETLRAIADYAVAVEGAMPAFPGWELPQISVPMDAGMVPFAAGARLAPEGVTVGVGLPAGAFKMMCEAVCGEPGR